MVTCNTTLENLTINEKDLSIGITFHHLALILCAVFGLIASVISLYLLIQHANHYSRPLEQKHIIRILFMIPVYAVANFLSLKYYLDAIYYTVLSDCYEAIAIASFFTLMCNYLAPNLHDQKEFFRTQIPKNWSWVTPIRPFQKCTGGENKGPFRKPRSGLTWFNVIWICVFQYCFVRVFFTVVSVLTEATGTYCEESLSPAFAHIWVTCFEGVSVTIAMVGLIQFYVQLKEELAEHKPGMKLLCIKLVIFFSFWQTIIISLASSSSGPLKPTEYVGYQDIKNGVPAVLSNIEMSVFAILHVFAFPWRKPYSIPTGNAKINSATPYNDDPLNAYGSGYSGVPRYYGGFMGWKAYVDACNPWDLIKACARGFRWLFVGRRHRTLDSSYRSRSSIVEAGAATGLGGTKLKPLGSDAGVKHGVTVQDMDEEGAYEYSTSATAYQGAIGGRFDRGNNNYDRPVPETRGGGGSGGNSQQLAPHQPTHGLSDSASDLSDGPGGSYGEENYFEMPGESYHEEVVEEEDHRAGLLSNAAPSPTRRVGGGGASAAPSKSVRKTSPYSPAPLEATHPAFRRSDDASQQRASAEEEEYEEYHESIRRNNGPGRGGGGTGPGGSGWV